MDPCRLAAALNVAPANTTLSTLRAALNASGLLPALGNSSLAWTVFAPTNDAFTAAIVALNTNASALLANRALLTQILSYHVIPSAAVTSDQLEDGQMLPTLLGPSLTVGMEDDNVTIMGASNMANVIAADIVAGQSIVHVIDAVLVPPMNMSGTTMAASTTDNDNDGTAVASGAGSTQTATGGTAAPTTATSGAASMGLASGALAAAAVLGSLLL